jgi:hypothetical protein
VRSSDQALNTKVGSSRLSLEILQLNDEKSF